MLLQLAALFGHTRISCISIYNICIIYPARGYIKLLLQWNTSVNKCCFIANNVVLCVIKWHKNRRANSNSNSDKQLGRRGGLCVCGGGGSQGGIWLSNKNHISAFHSHTHTHTDTGAEVVYAVCCLLRLIKNVPHVNGNFVNFYLFISSATANSPWTTAPLTLPSTLPTFFLFYLPAYLSFIPHFIDIAHFLSFSFSLSLSCVKCFMCSAGNVPSAVINTNIFMHLCVRVCLCVVRHLAFNGPHN